LHANACHQTGHSALLESLGYFTTDQNCDGLPVHRAASGIGHGRSLGPGLGLSNALVAHAPRSYPPWIDLHGLFDERWPARDRRDRHGALRPRRLGAPLLDLGARRPGRGIHRIDLAGVGRVFGVDVKWSRVLEWSTALDGWRELDASGHIDDPALEVPLPIEAILHAAKANDAIARALLARLNPVIEARLAERATTRV
jgi:hypothetical protein